MSFLNDIDGWIRAQQVSFGPSDRQNVETRRLLYLKTLAMCPVPDRQTDLIERLQRIRERALEEFHREEECFKKSGAKELVQAVKRGLVEKRSLHVRGQTVVETREVVTDHELAHKYAQRHINAIKTNPKWAQSLLDSTRSEVATLMRMRQDPIQFERPPRTDSERNTFASGGPPAVRLLLDWITGLFQAAYEKNLLGLCDLCPHRGVIPPRVFIRGPHQGHRKDCDQCGRLPEVTRWRIRQRSAPASW